ncbi:MAG: hypothetical protein AB7O24_14225 [Kofleriaceae bacterium]
MRWSCLAVVLSAGACGFQPTGGIGSDAGGVDVGTDGMVDGPMDPPIPTGTIDFLPETEEMLGTGDLMINTDVVLDTSAPALVVPPGVSLAVGVQENQSEVAILRVRDLKINNNKTLRVIGTRPFVILAARDIDIDGTLDVGGHGAVPGPGGGAPDTGPGKGFPGTHQANGNADSGGGGGSFGSPGARGGDSADQAGGAPGAMYSVDAFLVGGSSGGLARAVDCPYPSGAGGGAVLIFAGRKVLVKGAINAGGGGGAGGSVCTMVSGAGSGTGGGSGGVIWIQTPELGGDGVLAANGGGGGGGGYAESNTPGMPGQDGQPDTAMAANGGIPADDGYGSAGGNGAVEGKSATRGGDRDSGNAGGGGGGVGHIVTRTSASPTLATSPAVQWSLWQL